MKYLGRYIHKCRKGILAAAAFCLTFGLIFYLYNVSVGPIIYAAAVYLLGLLAVMGLDYLRFRKKVSDLESIRSQVPLILEALPEASDEIERLYQDALKGMYEGKCEADNQAAYHYSEMMEYFTLWAHQIKTPIAAIHLLLQADDEYVKEELEEQLFKTEQYVEMVLQYLRMGNMSGDLVIRQYNLDDIVRQAVRKYAKLFIRKKIKLDFRDTATVVITDEKWLVFVIEQLLSNALKYTRSGTISIYLSQDAEKTLIIEDTGIGIQEEDLPRIFERGYTGYNGRKDKKSTGIGLYLCRTIMGRLNHGLTIESEPEQGTRVLLDLKSAELQVD